MYKLKDLMKMFGPYNIIHVKIWIDGEGEEYDKPIYEGLLSEVPYWLAQKKLVEPKEEYDYCAVQFYDKMDENKNYAGFGIILTDDEGW